MHVGNWTLTERTEDIDRGPLATAYVLEASAATASRTEAPRPRDQAQKTVEPPRCRRGQSWPDSPGDDRVARV